MKRILIAVLAATSLLFAESYQVNTLSAKQMGMAHTGAGIKLGSESMNFNPGGLGFLNKTLDISLGATFIMPTIEYKGDYGKATNDELGTPLYVYVGSGITDWLSVGLSFTTPYGNTVDYGKDWVGAGLLQSISLSVYALQPTVAFKPIDQLSIGIGPVINFGSFEQSKSLSALVASNVNKQLQAAGIPAIATLPNSAVSANFSGDADVAIAVNAGVMYDIIPDKLTFGVGYRSEAKAKVAKGKGKIEMDDAAINANLGPFGVTSAAVAAGLPTLDQGTFEAELPLPANLNTGISFRPIDALLLAFDWQMIFWGNYKKLTLEFTDAIVGQEGGNGLPTNKQSSEKKYHNANAFRLGAQYTVIEQLDARLGAYYDQTPVDDDYLTPESPSTNKLGLTLGASYRPISNLSIDASFLYATSLGDRDATSGKKTDSNGNQDGIDGKYKVTALVPAVGLNFSF